MIGFICINSERGVQKRMEEVKNRFSTKSFLKSCFWAFRDWASYENFHESRDESRKLLDELATGESRDES